MFRAELHGKLPRNIRNLEDLLTSSVFGFLELADRRIFLYRYVRDYLKLEISTTEAANAEFQFWPSYDDGTEPDVVVTIGNWYLLFEAKLFSHFGLDASDSERNQLRRELREGQRESERRGLKFRLVTVTRESWKDVKRYPDIKPADRMYWIWSNWQTVHALLEDTLEATRGVFGLQLLQLLDNRGLRGFRGFQNTGTAPPAPEFVFLKSNATRSAGFTGFKFLDDAKVEDVSFVFWSPPKKFSRYPEAFNLPTKIYWSQGEYE